MKTVREHIQDLPEDIREKFVANCDTEGYLEKVEPDLSNCIKGGFVWKYSPEGLWYWDEVYEDCLNGKYQTT